MCWIHESELLRFQTEGLSWAAIRASIFYQLDRGLIVEWCVDFASYVGFGLFGGGGGVNINHWPEEWDWVERMRA